MATQERLTDDCMWEGIQVREFHVCDDESSDCNGHPESLAGQATQKQMFTVSKHARTACSSCLWTWHAWWNLNQNAGGPCGPSVLK